ncbi:thioredoxin fold domain-containing protein [Haliscomenobacter sp.]|uniref:thioredoxin family protein n=1 Tax=Haliscomenobacter sp. TaxID=2717303 RepID=UPI003BA877D3
MNRFAFFILLLGMGVGLIAQENAAGISFQQGEFQAMLDKAKAENKLIFMDVYTTWCGPCKMLDRNTFSDAQVGSKFNASFVNYKLDAEKGEGINIARKYAVRAYPNMLFINGQGEVVHRVVGYRPPEELLKDAETAAKLLEGMKPLSWFDENYGAKKNDKAFMQAYLGKLKESGKETTKVLNEYLALIPANERGTETVVKLAADNLTQLDGPAYQLLAGIMREAGKYSNASVQAAYSALGKLKNQLFNKAVQAKDHKLLDRLIQISKETDGPGAEAQIAQYEFEFAKATGDLSVVRKIMEQKANSFLSLSNDALKKQDAESLALYKKQAILEGEDTTSAQFVLMREKMKNTVSRNTALELNELAMKYLESMTDKADLTKALAWSARSLELDRDVNFLDTYANLLYKLGRKAEAIKFETEAMEKASPEEKEMFQDTLDKMKKGTL